MGKPAFHEVLSLAWIALGGVLMASSASADPNGTLNQIGSDAGPVPRVAPQAAPTGRWQDATEASCGMVCRYRRANDNLTFQALYSITKLGKIGELITSQKPSNWEESARTALGGFCENTAEKVTDCFTRYKAFQKVALQQIRQAIGKNEEMVARLTSGRRNDGTVSGDAIAFAPDVANTPYIPEVYTLSDLEKSYLDGKLRPNGGKFTSGDIRKWSIELVGFSKSGQRYLEFGKETVDANPFQADKDKNKVHMVVRDGNGTPQGDKAVLDSTTKATKASIDDVVSGKKKLGQGDGQGVKAIAPKDLKKEDAVSYDALTEARSILNSRIAGDVQNENSPSSDRKPAGKTDPSTPTSSTASSTATTPTGPQSHDVVLKDNQSRKPSSYRNYGDEERVQMPEQNQDSRYIRYDLNKLFDDIEDSTK